MNYLKQYEQYLNRRNYSEHTVIHYLSDLSLLKEHTKKNWRKITKKEVADFIEDQIEKSFCPATINRRLYVIKGFYEFLKEELELKIANPVRFSQHIRRGRRLPKTLSNGEVHQLFKVITDSRDRAVFSLMLRCGLRVGEVANLEVGQVDLFGKKLRFIGKGDKERVVPIPQEVFEMLLQCIKIRPSEAPKFFWNKKSPLKPVKINSIQRLLKRYGDQAGINVHCHLLRHTFARQLTEKGVDRTVLRDLLGHSSIASTDGYGKLSDPFVKQSYFEAMEKILSDNPVTMKK